MSSRPEYRWDTLYSRYKRMVYESGSGQWLFAEWMPVGWQLSTSSQSSTTTNYKTWPEYHLNPDLQLHGKVQVTSGSPPAPVATRRALPLGLGSSIKGDYFGTSESLHYEAIDPSFYVRSKDFFFEGRVFAVIMNESAGGTAREDATNYNDSQSVHRVKYLDNLVYTSTRRFIVVRQRKEFCFACPIFTYSGRATTKPGVRAAEHGIAYSWGQEPQLFDGETGISKLAVAVVMSPNEPPLHRASRVYYGIHHPIQYNVKVKDVGYVPATHIPTLIGNWKEEEYTEHPADVDENSDDFEPSTNPRAYFKKGRVFRAIWPDTKEASDETPMNKEMFAVVKSNTTFCVCLRISTYSGLATTQPGVNHLDHAAVIPLGGIFTPHDSGEQLEIDPIEVKVENTAVTIDPMSRINLAAPYSIEHTVRICNVGRVVASSVALLERTFAEKLGFVKA